MAIVFNGRQRQQELARRWRQNLSKLGPGQRRRRLVSVLVGDDPASQLYVRMKENFARRIGVNFQVEQFPTGANPGQVMEAIIRWGSDGDIAGLMVQLPLPKSWPAAARRRLLDAIPPIKDIDCLTSQNLGLLLAGRPRFLPATVAAVADILAAAGLPAKALAGKSVCVIGKSLIVGAPLANWLMRQGATVASCDSYTRDLAAWTSRAEVVVSAAGQPGLISESMVARGVVAVDVSSPRGDFDFAPVAAKARFITPVPGGVGPLTVAFLMGNFLRTLRQQ